MTGGCGSIMTGFLGQKHSGVDRDPDLLQQELEHAVHLDQCLLLLQDHRDQKLFIECIQCKRQLDRDL